MIEGEFMNEPFIQKEKEYFTIPDWTQLDPYLVVGFTTKIGGFSKEEYSTLNMGFHVGDQLEDVKSNRLYLAEKLNVPIHQWVGAKQIHHNVVAMITDQNCNMGATDYESALEGIDGMITDHKEILLTLCFADCVPIYFFAPKSHVVGIAHAGWKGTVLQISKEMIRSFSHKGVSRSEIEVVIGPSICRSCYIVDDRVIKEVDKLINNQKTNVYDKISKGQYALDLKALNYELLIQEGIPKENIKISSLCTSCQSSFFYSHRRDNGKTGRMMAFIGWKGE